jgi:hypothetical protein
VGVVDGKAGSESRECQEHADSGKQEHFSTTDAIDDECGHERRDIVDHGQNSIYESLAFLRCNPDAVEDFGEIV